jgi:hypothetical protein
MQTLNHQQTSPLKSLFSHDTFILKTSNSPYLIKIIIGCWYISPASQSLKSHLNLYLVHHIPLHDHLQSKRSTPWPFPGLCFFFAHLIPLPSMVTFPFYCSQYISSYLTPTQSDLSFSGFVYYHNLHSSVGMLWFLVLLITFYSICVLYNHATDSSRATQQTSIYELLTLMCQTLCETEDTQQQY